MKTPDSLKLIVTRMRNAMGKPSNSYCAQLGNWNLTTNGADEAVAALDNLIQQSHRHACTRRYLIARDGTVFALSFALGWTYDIIHTDKPGAQSPGSCCLTCGSFVEAYDAMKRHWEQYDADCVAQPVAA